MPGRGYGKAKGTYINEEFGCVYIILVSLVACVLSSHFHSTYDHDAPRRDQWQQLGK